MNDPHTQLLDITDGYLLLLIQVYRLDIKATLGNGHIRDWDINRLNALLGVAKERKLEV